MMTISWSIRVCVVIQFILLEFRQVKGESAVSCRKYGDEHIGFSYDCDGVGLSTIPKDFHENTLSIKLNKNHITEIKADSFSKYINLHELSLMKNKLSVIDIHAFNNNVNLSSLDISQNQLREIKPGTLAPLKQLMDLRISQNQIQGFTKLTKMICQTNKEFNFIHLDIHDGFSFHDYCKNMSLIRILALNPREKLSFLNESLLVFQKTKIVELWIIGSNKACVPIESSFLSPLHQLQVLIIDYFYMSISYVLNRLIYPFRNRTLDGLIVSGISIDRMEMLSHEALEYLPSICIKKLTLFRCRIQSIDYNKIRGSNLWSCLESFEFRENYMANLRPFLVTLALPKIKHIDGCCQRVRQGTSDDTFDPLPRLLSDMKSQSQDHPPSFNSVELYLSNSTKYFSLSNNDFRSIVFTFDLIIHGSLEVLELNNLRFPTCEGRLLGLQKLKILEIRQWNCKRMNPDLVTQLSSMRNLSIAKSNIGQNARTFPIINNLTNLIYLDMSENSVDDLYPSFFRCQIRSLLNLSLADNNLRSIPKALFVLKNLKHLDVRLNLLNRLSSDEMSFIDGLNDLKIYLGGNSLICSCESLKFLQWVKSNNKKIKDYGNLTCEFNKIPGIKLANVIKELHQMEINCISSAWLGISVSGLVLLILSVVLTILLYKFQPDVRYVISRFKRTLRRLVSKAHRVPIISHMQYHAFVSYGDLNYQWACDILCKTLATEGFRLIHEKNDFLPGIPLIDSICEAIDKSRRVIFVLTHDFLENEWNEYQIQIARLHAFRNERTNFIIVILLDDIPPHEIPDSLRRIWIRVKCIKWPKDGDKNSILSFWEELRNELTMD